MPERDHGTPWTGEWVTEHLGVRLAEQPRATPVRSLAGLALRRNPRRAHLVVSGVLGKHVPVDPRVVRDSGAALGTLVAAELSAADGRPLVLGYAETATGLGHCVADVLGATYLSSTRRVPPGRTSALGFEEQHSHASSHHLVPDDPALLDASGPVVLVDDELTTGTTALNTIRAWQGRARHPLYVVAALLDLRTTEDRRAFELAVADLGVPVVVVATARGVVELPEDVLTRGAALVAALPAPDPVADAGGRWRQVDVAWPAGLRYDGRGGFTPVDRDALDRGFGGWSDQVGAALGEPVAALHVLGTEELMHLPMQLGCALAEALPDTAVTFSTTTRSPVAVVDDPGYPIRSALCFPATDGTDDAPRFAYNLGPDRFDRLVVVLDTDPDAAAAPGGLLDELCRVVPEVVVVVVPDLLGSPR